LLSLLVLLRRGKMKGFVALRLLHSGGICFYLYLQNW
jgi:hypothetical protein